MTSTTRLTLTLLATAIGALTGCSVWIPYVEAPEPGVATEPVPYARSVQKSLQKSARQHTGFSAGMGSALIPLASLVAYKGFAQGNAHNLAALASGGAAAYGMTNYVYRPRELTYFAGAAAIDCAVRLTEPDILMPAMRGELERESTLLRADDASIVAMKQSFAAAAVAITAARTSAAAARAALQAAKRDAVTARLGSDADTVAVFTGASSELDALELAATAASARRQDLSSRFNQLPALIAKRRQADARASRDLVDTTRSILTQVNLQLAASAPDPAALAAQLSGLKLPAAATEPAAAAKPVVLPSLGEKSFFSAEFVEDDALFAFSSRALKRGDSEELAETKRAALERLDRHLEEFRMHLGAARASLDTTTIALDEAESPILRVEAVAAIAAGSVNIAKLYEDCALDDHLPTPLTVSPPKDGAAMAATAKLQVPVVGGSKPYSAVAVSKPAAGTLTVEVVEGLGNSRVITLTTEGATPGSYVILIQDARGKAVQFTVTISA